MFLKFIRNCNHTENTGVAASDPQPYTLWKVEQTKAFNESALEKFCDIFIATHGFLFQLKYKRILLVDQVLCKFEF